MDDDFIHPYIPNSEPNVKSALLDLIGAKNADELYEEMIPSRLMLKESMDLPAPIPSEYDLRKYMNKLLDRNVTTDDYISFLGSGCWKHYVPKVCEVIASRSEFLTAYAGGSHSDLGRFQANFEFQSLICDLLGMEVSGIPTYDWGSAAGNSIRMVSRLTSRKEVLIPRNISPARRQIIENFCDSVDPSGRIKIKPVDFDIESGRIDLEDLESKINEDTAGVYIENPNYLGIIESDVREISEIVHNFGAEFVCGVDPISLGILSPPSDYGVDITCGEVQPLGIHMHAGGGSCGFIATSDEERYVAEYPLRLISITETDFEGEYGFGQALYERTSYISRESAKDWVGTTTALWGITAAVYLSLMGPQGIKEIGDHIIRKSHYTAKLLDEINGVDIPYTGFFKEFPVQFQTSIRDINEKLLEHKILGGKDISNYYPVLGNSAIYCVTEMHSVNDIQYLQTSLMEVLR
ncbi:aminomethyl-transferring glycine dehydrogenase subunit GcvPA [Candidatus Bathyarchaeota archaeon]|nr:aminomethyl-transferring glycine dehydrogenase subunit GcvPA [Candidatus Bathyarchaeota archaeon]